MKTDSFTGKRLKLIFRLLTASSTFVQNSSHSRSFIIILILGFEVLKTSFECFFKFSFIIPCHVELPILVFSVELIDFMDVHIHLVTPQIVQVRLLVGQGKLASDHED